MKGLIMEKYAVCLLENLKGLDTIDCNIPVELWQIGKEVSDSTMEKLRSIYKPAYQHLITFRDIGSMCLIQTFGEVIRLRLWCLSIPFLMKLYYVIVM